MKSHSRDLGMNSYSFLLTTLISESSQRILWLAAWDRSVSGLFIFQKSLSSSQLQVQFLANLGLLLLTIIKMCKERKNREDN